MKTNLLFAAAFLLSTTGFAQTTVKATQQQASGVTANAANASASSNASANAMVTSDAGAKTASKANAAKTAISSEISAEKAKAIEKTAAAAHNTKKEVKAAGNTQASVTADGSINSQSANNKADGKTSIHSDVAVSGKQATQSVKAANYKVQADAKAKTAETVHTTAVVKTKVVNTVKPKPVAIKMQAQLKGNAGLKIK